MLEISLDASRLEHGLGQLLKNATNTRPMMRAIATEMVSLTEDNFENESWDGCGCRRRFGSGGSGRDVFQSSGGE